MRQRGAADSTVRAVVREGLGGALEPTERARLLARVDRVLPDVSTVVEALYGTCDVTGDLTTTFLRAAVRAAARRPQPLRELDAHREADREWFLRPDRVGYLARASAFGSDLRGVARRIDHLVELGVTHLMLVDVLGAEPFARPETQSGGVDPTLGDRADLGRLAGALRARGVSLGLNVMMSSTSADHTWARRARAGSPSHQDHFLTYADRALPDVLERSLGQRADDDGWFTFDEALARWVWTTHGPASWDLNWANPKVALEMADELLALADAGVEVLRLDDLERTWKRVGTACVGEPEVHLITQLLRALMEIAAPAVLLQAGTLSVPDDAPRYLGLHARDRAQCQLAEREELSVLVWSSLATQDAHLAVTALDGTPTPPPGSTWVTYVRDLDPVRWTVRDADAEAVGLSGPAHRAFLAEWFCGAFPTSPARGETGAPASPERTSGTTAALCGVTDARRRGDDAALLVAAHRLLLAYGVVLAFDGIPVLCMGDEIALDSQRMDWAAVTRRLTDDTVEHRIHDTLRRMLAVRAATPAMASGGQVLLQHHDDPAAFVWQRWNRHHGAFAGVANVSSHTITLPWSLLRDAGIVAPRELLDAPVYREDERLVVPPLTVAWYVDAVADSTVPLRPTPRRRPAVESAADESEGSGAGAEDDG